MNCKLNAPKPIKPKFWLAPALHFAVCRIFTTHDSTIYYKLAFFVHRHLCFAKKSSKCHLSPEHKNQHNMLFYNVLRSSLLILLSLSALIFAVRIILGEIVAYRQKGLVEYKPLV